MMLLRAHVDRNGFKNMAHIPIFLAATLLFFLFQIRICASSSKVPDIGAKQKKSGFIDGDFIIGALFPVHEEPLLKGGTDPLVCGEIRERYGIQRVEAAFFAIDSINDDKNILPGINLGINIKDACSSEAVSLHQTIKLIEDPVPLSDEEKITPEKCLQEDDDDDAPLIGIIGPTTSTTTVTVQNLLKLFHIPQIGYSATSSRLVDRRLFHYFLRVVPNDEYQVFVMFKLLFHFGWKYISVVYSTGEYGQTAANFIKDFASYYDVCIAQIVEVPVFDDDESSSAYTGALIQLSEDKKAKVVITFCEGEANRNLLKATRKMNLTGEFLFLGSDTWSNRLSVVRGYEEEALGSLTVAIKQMPDEEFDEYFFTRNLTNNKRNPWFKEFWEYRFDCTLNSTSDSYSAPCTGEEDLRQEHRQDSKIPYIIKSIYAMAHGLREMHSDVCQNETLCDEFYPFNSTKYMEYLKKINFMYKNEPVNFTDVGGPWRISYSIYNFQKYENGEYGYEEVSGYDGNYDELKGYDEYDENDFFLGIKQKVQFPKGKTKPIKSVCSEPCPAGQIQFRGSGSQLCCWNCNPCPVGEFQLNLTHCKSCPLGHWPIENQTKCAEVPLTYTRWLDIQSIISVIISTIGITLTIATAMIFFKYRETPVVKSSTRELCYMMLIGMITAHCISFAIISKPSLISCTIVRTVPAISFTTIYAALLVKTNRIARILAISKKKFPNLNPRFMSLEAQITITSIFIAIETVVCLVMLIREPSSPKTEYTVVENQLYINLVCPVSNAAILYPFSFVGFLIVMCTLYAIKTRNLPDNFNEAKFIGFSMYVTCITWIAFGLVYYGSNLQVITTCICASTNALVILIFLFFPKLYIILCVPEKNTRANFTTSKGIRCIIGREESSQNTSKGILIETNFKYIPDFSAQKNKSAPEPLNNHSMRRKSLM